MADFDHDVAIDYDALEVEWLKQPTLHKKYSRKLVEANDRLRKAEQRMKVIRSDLILEANENPDKYLGKGIKPTAPLVEAYYRTHEDHIEAKNEYFEALKEVEGFQHAVNVVNTKKSALENLSRLCLADYFSKPREPHNIGKEFRERVQEQKEEDTKERRERTKTKLGHRTK